MTDGITQTVTRFTYNADGALYMKIAPDGTVTVYPGRYIEYEISGGGTIATSYYYHAGRRVAMRAGSTVYYLYGDHLGSMSLTTDEDGNNPVRQLYHPYGTVRWSSGSLPTDFTFTGQRSDGYTQLIQMGARWYEARIGRWVSADAIVPDPANPQSLNRYSYVLASPLRLTDPSGFDPLDDKWRQDFREKHGRDPGSLDVLIRLFSIALPGEWDAATHDALYDSDENVRVDALRDLFASTPEGRDWIGMPTATEAMAGWYEPWETEELIRDIGSLFAGLPNRFEERSGWAAVRQGIVGGRPLVWLGREGLPGELLGTDVTGNVHHWAWSLNLGYFRGGLVGSAINFGRELQSSGWSLRDVRNDANHVADVRLGRIGAYMGNLMRGPYTTPQGFRSTWSLMPLTVSN